MDDSLPQLLPVRPLFLPNLTLPSHISHFSFHSHHNLIISCRWHRENAYTHLFNTPTDARALAAVIAFNPYDLYSKSDDPIKVEELKPYYEGLIKKFFPDVVEWWWGKTGLGLSLDEIEDLGWNLWWTRTHLSMYSAVVAGNLIIPAFLSRSIAFVGFRETPL